MDDDFPTVHAEPEVEGEKTEPHAVEEIARLTNDFRCRLIAANLRTEAVRAGMVDLDGLRLLDLSEVDLDDNDKIVDGRKLMIDLRRAKPWLFAPASTSSAAIAPVSQPVRQKTAMDMSDEEYVAARSAVTKYQF